jgi:hypothetical protein
LEKSLTNIIFLDDQEWRARKFLALHPDAVWVKNSRECIRQLYKEWDEIHLDYQLADVLDSGRDDTGMEVVRFIVEHRPERLRGTLFVVHSLRPSAAMRMVTELRAAGYIVERKPFDLG